jgi:hypothetical protein
MNEPGFGDYLESLDADERAVAEQLLEQGDPVLRALARAPVGPADPPEVRAAIELGKALGHFVPGHDVSAEIQGRACDKVGP